jgi:hypothetical protein
MTEGRIAGTAICNSMGVTCFYLFAETHDHINLIFPGNLSRKRMQQKAPAALECSKKRHFLFQSEGKE